MEVFDQCMYNFSMLESLFNQLHAEILQCAIADLDTSWNKSYTLDPFNRLYFVMKGEAIIHHHHKDFLMKAKEYHLIPQDTVLSFHCDDRVTIAYIHFNASFSGGIDLFSYADLPFHIQSRDPQFDLLLWKNLIDANAGSIAGEQLKSSGTLSILLSYFLEESKAPEGRQQQIARLGPAITYLTGHLKERISLREWAASVNLTAQSFSRLFSQTFGIPPFRYLHARKIEQAQYYLWQTNASLGEIAREFSYSDAFHFSKTFKNHTGISPRDFRKLKPAERNSRNMSEGS